MNEWWVALWEVAGLEGDALRFLLVVTHVGPPFDEVPLLLLFFFPNIRPGLPEDCQIGHPCRKDRQRVIFKFGGDLQWGRGVFRGTAWLWLAFAV